jgi:SAM-dependent methyltransferase
LSTLRFDDDLAQLQRTVAQCEDMVVRRSAVLGALNLRMGERVLEVGCGGGSYAQEAARSVGPSGRVCAVDLSADQIAAAQARCSELDWVECRVADAVDLPYDDGLFDAVFGTQVFEYVARLDDALQEAHRVLRPGGRLLVLATNWSSLVWHSDEPERMRRVLAAWERHAPYPDLPSILAPRLRQAGMRPLRQVPVPIVNMSYHANSFGYWGARLIRSFVVGAELIAAHEADAWLDEFEALEARGAYFLSSTPILTEAVKLTDER